MQGELQCRESYNAWKVTMQEGPQDSRKKLKCGMDRLFKDI